MTSWACKNIGKKVNQLKPMIGGKPFKLHPHLVNSELFFGRS